MVFWILTLQKVCRMQYSMLLARFFVFAVVVQEHWVLRLSQLQCEEYVYREKNLNGSFKQLHINSKVVPMFPVQKNKKGAQSACISKLPPEAKEDLLCVRPLDKYYGHRIRICRGTAAVPLGKHTLSSKSRKCTQKQVSLGTRRIIASEQLVLRSCTRKVLLKS